ncbi:GspE/PulE family protein [Gallionella capsiferriformans]|jgi:type II secretory ATPase GspE/PulE/Tfp pilus assembly ATPase PilB-like protein|uniref:Type II secretion system protein E n=1 Tax=Gallionella capsiferriformans (strain ES-2) TaxID=395494 RepID=D9SD16_GALCS|nr:ATPase, T2SS/T4P/T4SS family [Gallionella capsiferriformans]ADL54705.1 type II secretion system protein E [Gallionella capsiferriformans ES-2]
MKLSLWPTPFYYKFEEDLEAFDSEPCLIIATDGQEYFGDLMRFAPEEGVFKIQPFNGGISRLKEESVNYLRLLHPVHLIKISGLINETHAVFGASEKQACSIVFVNDKRLDGETVGFAIDKTGLYLFLVHTDDSVIRCFIPAVSIKHYQIGKKIGQMLIEEKIATHKEINSGLEKQEQMRHQRLGEYLTNEQIVSSEQLVAALGRQSGTVLKLGDMLVNENLITHEVLQEALAKQRTDKKVALGEILINMGVVNTEVVQSMLAKKLGIPFVNVRKFFVEPSTFHLVPINFVTKYSILPLYHTDHSLIVAMENPLLWEPLNELRVITHLTVVPVLAAREDIVFVINELRNEKTSRQRIDELAVGMTFDGGGEESGEELVAETDNTLVGLVNKMMLDAYDQGVSDIHIETYPDKRNTQVRFRRDGVISKYFEFPPAFKKALISRIKIMAKLDISERRRPQDGKIELKLSQDHKVEFRVATVPTANGLEDVVLRVLTGAKPMPLELIGLPADVLARMKELAVRPYGLFLICGPTGSGKTTTLHSVLGLINSPDRKIWTAEDPIEITQEGLRQVQINANIGWTFAAAMRSFLRADPDVIMVGEIRDIETAKIAIQASLTGHMVFSTLHTNSAAESLVRLLDLGMDPFNFSDALVGILAQRLTRRYCQECREIYTATDEEIQALAEEYCTGTPQLPEQVIQNWRKNYLNTEGKFSLYAAHGCRECEGSGYKGRVGLYELLEATPPIKKLIQHQGTVEQIQTVAAGQCLRTLKQAGIELVLQGQTNILQIRSVCN